MGPAIRRRRLVALLSSAALAGILLMDSQDVSASIAQVAGTVQINWVGDASQLLETAEPVDMVLHDLTRSRDVFRVQLLRGSYAAVAIVQDDYVYGECTGESTCTVGAAIYDAVEQNELRAQGWWSPQETANGYDNSLWSWGWLYPGHRYRVELFSDGAASVAFDLSGANGTTTLTATGSPYGLFRSWDGMCSATAICSRLAPAQGASGGYSYNLGNMGVAISETWFNEGGALDEASAEEVALSQGCIYPRDPQDLTSASTSEHPHGCDEVSRPGRPLVWRQPDITEESLLDLGTSFGIGGGVAGRAAYWQDGPQYIGYKYLATGLAPAAHGAWGLWVPYALHGPYPPREPRAVRADPAPAVDGARVAWVAPADTGGSPLTGYRIYAGRDASNLAQIATVGPGLLEYTVADCPSTTCVYAVTALNFVGEGPPSSA
jgi:hypothetical protein